VRTTPFFFLLSLLFGCSDPPLLELKLVTPEGPDPLATADRLRVILSEPAVEKTIATSGGATIDLDLRAEVSGAVGTVLLEAMAGETLVARGETPPMVLRPVENKLSLLVARAGAFSRLLPRLEAPATEMSNILLPSLGVLLAGGLDAQGRPSTGAALYDFFDHVLESLPPLPEPRAGALGIPCGASCGLVAFGGNEGGLATEILRFDGVAWQSVPDKLPPTERRRDASLAPLADGTYLAIGGRGPTGAMDTMLSIDPGDLLKDPTLKVSPVRTRAPRIRPATAVAAVGAVIVVGGQEAGDPQAEIFYPASSSFQVLSLPGPIIASGAAAVELGDGQLVVLGGRDGTGVLLRDAWVIQPATLEVRHLPEALREGRADHRVVRVGQYLVILGGVQKSGLAARAEVLEASSLACLAEPEIGIPRKGFVVERLGPGSLLIVGGESAEGPEVRLEVYETSAIFGR
jgi:hypothetical protein